MAMIKCKGCKDNTPEHDTLEGYCMVCAAQRIHWESKFRTENKELQERIKELETDKEILRLYVGGLENAQGFLDDRIKIIKTALQEISNQLLDLYTKCNERTGPEVYGAILGLHERLEQILSLFEKEE